MLDWLLPQRCVVCSRGGAQLCDACRRALPRLGWPCCERCGAPGAWPVRRCAECAGRRLAFASARAGVAYDERVRRLVTAWKEQSLRRLAAVAADLVAEVVAAPEADALTFVPPDRDRTLERGHHPAERLARELSARWELPLATLLRRTRPAPQQRGSSLTARRRNVRGAFLARRAPKRVVLVDDVYTSWESRWLDLGLRVVSPDVAPSRRTAGSLVAHRYNFRDVRGPLRGQQEAARDAR